ncbi:hypothetical protein CYMTET_8547 [Cymbomonas tetramitiformis]|uniref:Uncharacterized protein n=1 Tax=Cymbomonas tetramitiformis TaxID=36881 RepID=A0AAE0GTB8_9CHLO|nr:hypothetical protein CYMTET_8547 [Cymbomonas tetramitiformis]
MSYDQLCTSARPQLNINTRLPLVGAPFWKTRRRRVPAAWQAAVTTRAVKTPAAKQRAQLNEALGILDMQRQKL